VLGNLDYLLNTVQLPSQNGERMKDITTKDLGVMNIGEGLYSWFMTNLSPGSTILELGSGLGTQLLSETFNMISIEHDKKFMNLYNSHYILSPIKEVRKGLKWYDPDIVKNSIKDLEYDLFFVDGPQNSRYTRKGILYFLNLFNTKVPFVFDDCQTANVRELAEKVSEKLDKKIQFKQDGKKYFAIVS